MNSKWYIGTLIILMAFLGLNQEQPKVANQQIVLQFSEVEMTSSDAVDDALALVTKKLEAFGVTDVTILEKGDSQLSIRYYSAIDAIRVSELLSQDNEISLTYSDVAHQPIELPSDQDSEVIHIVITDLQQQFEDGFGLNGKLAFELNHDYKRLSNPVLYVHNKVIVLEQNAYVKVAFRINNIVASTIDNTSNAIPEVRAGPITNGNS